MLGMMAQWIYDKPPLQGIRFEEPLRQLKSELAVSLLRNLHFQNKL